MCHYRHIILILVAVASAVDPVDECRDTAFISALNTLNMQWPPPHDLLYDTAYQSRLEIVDALLGTHPSGSRC